MVKVKGKRASKAPARRVVKTQRAARTVRTRAPAVRRASINPLTSLKYLDPLGHPEPPLSATSLGHATTINSVVRYTQGTSTTLRTVHILQWNPSGVAVLKYLWDGTTATAFAGGVTRVFLPYFDPALNIVPTSIRPARMAIRVRNYTIFTSMVGQVKILSIPEGLEWEFQIGATDLLPSNTMAAEVESMVNGHKDTRTITASDLHTTKSFVVPPASAVGYNQWYPFSQAAPANTTPWALTQTALADGAESNAFYTTIVFFDASSSVNSYGFTVHRQDQCRYPANTIMSSHAKAQPVGSADVIHAVHTAAASNAGVALEAGAAAGAVFSGVPGRVARFAGRVGRNGARLIRQAAAGGEAIMAGGMAEAELAAPLLGEIGPLGLLL